VINFASTLDHHAAVRPDEVALVWDGGSATWSELYERVNAVAAALAAQGVKEGDLIALVLQNRPEFIETIYAANRLGAAFLPINFRLAPREWRYILEHGGAAVVLTEADFEPQLASAVADLDITRITLAENPTEGFVRYDALVAPFTGTRLDVVDVAADSMQRLMYTSGTTAHPKGVRITHENFTWKSLGLLVQFGWDHTDVTVVGGPLYHVGALDMGGLTVLHVGGTLVLQPRFEAAGLLRLIEEHRATSCWLAPAMVNALLQQPELTTRDLSSLRTILSGGEKMPEARMRQILAALPDVWFADAYGLTETVSSDTFLDRDHMLSKLGSVGRALAHQQIRIVDHEGNPVPTGMVGEIALKGPKVFSGYWNDPDATDRAIRNGWFHTGDVGRLDEDGYLYIEDRKKDMIVSGGENVASPEVERALYEHPAVLEVAVVAHPDARWGEVPKAFIVVRDGMSVTSEELVEFCRERLARFKVPRHYEFIPVLPRTPSGKVLKRDLRDLDASAARETRATP
jgi:fatty-acyl-CoA synthase